MLQSLVSEINSVGRKGTSGFSISCRCEKLKSTLEAMGGTAMRSLVQRLAEASNGKNRDHIQKCEINSDGTCDYHVSFYKIKGAVTITEIGRAEIQQETWKIANVGEYKKKLQKAEAQLLSDNVLQKVAQSVANAQVSPCKGVTGYDEHVEQLSKGLWSRRINQKHRLVYSIDEKNKMIDIISVCGHYKKIS